MENSAVFSGFSRETVRFFTALRKNNNKEWFERNRETYDRHVLAPAKLFVTAMGDKLRTLAPRIVASPKINGSIFRIYRDTRFTLDPTPYKTNLGIFFWDGARPRLESAGFYFGLEPPTLMIGGGMYMIPASLLGRYRKAVVDPKSGKEIGRIAAAIRARPGYSVDGLHYKRVPAGFDPAHPNAELLKHNGLYAGVEAGIPEEFFSSRLVDYAFDRFEPLLPLHRWLMKLF
ncbi:MAG: hypothetical protein H6P98_3084 [Candidatus Aminicenantes bacterium]|nr:hypothetical protein [Candidatus Aminicenantes bacterium]